uniref:Uncharacterized protein n=1 Tax=Manihot esculenta TaxID=3983 RepID=A0A2C9U5Z5_MANES
MDPNQSVFFFFSGKMDEAALNFLNCNLVKLGMFVCFCFVLALCNVLMVQSSIFPVMINSSKFLFL